jgi:Tfp pilus assembly protein PilX
MVGFLAIGLVFTWLLLHRFRVAWLEYRSERLDLDAAVTDRRAEAAREAHRGASPTDPAGRAASPGSPPTSTGGATPA